ncbi:Hisactophilin-2 [Gossypium arboreum]|uniref:Hisactophilin-2 n=1 Tax=Gossypium arboreum TaxID=29729 RepID=A0A0B0MKY7_GOSAR|nr:Hisactophilin-2 [Gossypium arboreum]
MSQNMIKYHLIELSLFNTQIGSYVPVSPRTNIFLNHIIHLPVEPFGIEFRYSRITIDKYLYHEP